jgi:hypothetical protein
MAEPDPVTRLAETMAQVAASMHAPLAAEDALNVVTAAAVRSINGIDHASVSLTRADGRIVTLAPTSPLAEELDEIQYRLGEGPCLDAALEEPVVVAEHLAQDARWPAYGRAAAARGIGSQVAFQFRAHHDHIRGGLNLYAGGPESVDDQAMDLGALFAAQAAVIMGWQRHEQNLQTAVSAREQIGMAVGILMERYTLDAERAFGFLVRTSQSANLKVRDVAAGIVAQAVNGSGRPAS